MNQSNPCFNRFNFNLFYLSQTIQRNETKWKIKLKEKAAREILQSALALKAHQTSQKQKLIALYYISYQRLISSLFIIKLVDKKKYLTNRLLHCVCQDSQRNVVVVRSRRRWVLLISMGWHVCLYQLQQSSAGSTMQRGTWTSSRESASLSL